MALGNWSVQDVSATTPTPRDPEPAAGDLETLAGRTVLLDCRWLGLGGAGRVTELLLAALAATPPPGRWVLWGRADLVGAHAWPSARIARRRGDPRAAFGQRAALSVPPADVRVYMHQIRPLTGGRSLTFVHDTIPLRHGGRLPARLAKRAFFTAVARRSTRIATVSEFSRASIVRDLRVAPGRVAVLPVAAAAGRSGAVRRLRAQLGQRDVLLYVGRFGRHKNLPRLLTAFERSAFGRAGGRLLLVGGWGDEVEPLRRLAASRTAAVDVRGTCSEAELDRLLATSRALVLPSLEEGFGLPAYEAAAGGLPVAASATGALTELPPWAVDLFDPLDVDDMARAIDVATGRPPHAGASVRGDLRAAFLALLASCFDA